ncbi:DotD/TraH family lipoprotein [Paraburkholderia sp. BR10872]|uniref:DotD/TraH family lipoprotein n=1 Tax=Paraburkholderia sp. BR10872 TaxID=3236989 RepID=UPI0034D2A429
MKRQQAGYSTMKNRPTGAAMRLRVGSIMTMAVATACALAGCAQPAPIDPAAIQMDKQLDESARNIDSMLDKVARAGAISAAVPQAGTVMVSGQFITVRWKGNAAEVLRKIAEAKGLRFAEVGRPIASPVSIDATNTDFVSVLENIGTQLGGRADVVLKSDALEIRYRAS